MTTRDGSTLPRPLMATEPGETPEDTRIHMIRAARLIMAEHWPIMGSCYICHTQDCRPLIESCVYLEQDDYLPELLPSAQILIRAAQIDAGSPEQVRVTAERLLDELCGPREV